MKITTLIVAFILGFSFMSKAEISDPEGLFLEGNRYYDSNNYEQALVMYETLLEENYESVELYFNIGNCYYKKDNFAKSILNFERAKKLAPNREYITKNLELAQTKITDKPERSRMGVGPWVSSFFGFTTDFWAWVSIIFLVFSLISFVVFKRAYKPLFKNAGRIKFYMFSFLFLLFVIVSLVKYNAETNSNTAIVMEQSVALKTEPKGSSGNVLMLHEGSKIVILSQQNKWSEIRFGANGGWLENHFFEKI